MINLNLTNTNFYTIMRILTVFFLFICTALDYTSGLAQQAPGEELATRWTLQECIDYAIRHNITVQQSAYNVAASTIAVTQAKADLLPSVNGSASYSYNVGRSINPFTNQYEDNPVSSQNYGVSANLTLFDGLSRFKTIKRNQINTEASQTALEQTKNDITLNVISAYTQILLNRELLGNAEFRLSTTEMQLERTQKLVDAGSLPEGDVLQLQAQQASDEASIVNEENNLLLSILQLKQLLLIPADQPFEIVDPELDVPKEDELLESVESVYQRALVEQPSIRNAQLLAQSAEYDIAIAQANYYPTLALQGGIFTSYSSVAPDVIPRQGADNITTLVPTGGFIQGNPDMIIVQEQSIPLEFTENSYVNQLDFNLRKFIGFNLNIPIFNNLAVKSAVSNARINLEQARLSTVNEQNVLRQNIEQAYLDAVAARKSYEAAQRQVDALQLAFQNTETRFDLGAVNVLEYNQAKNQLDAAMTDLARSKYNAIFSTKLLDFYQGKPLSF